MWILTFQVNPQDGVNYACDFKCYCKYVGGGPSCETQGFYWQDTSLSDQSQCVGATCFIGCGCAGGAAQCYKLCPVSLHSLASDHPRLLCARACAHNPYYDSVAAVLESLSSSCDDVFVFCVRVCMHGIACMCMYAHPFPCNTYLTMDYHQQMRSSSFALIINLHH
jgi:hypothetical protein